MTPAMKSGDLAGKVAGPSHSQGQAFASVAFATFAHRPTLTIYGTLFVNVSDSCAPSLKKRMTAVCADAVQVT